MKFLTRLFSPDSAAKTIDRIAGGIDSAVYTPQERAQMKITQLQALEPFKVVQRILIASICFVWVMLIAQYSVAVWFGNAEVKSALIELIQSEFVWGPTLAGFGLYLGGGLKKSK